MMYPGVSRMTAATCEMASGEHQPCRRWAAARAGIAADRRSGYLAMWPSISARRSVGTSTVAGSGTGAGSLAGSTASSQPGTRDPCAKRVTLSPRAMALAVDPAQDGIEHRERRDDVGDVGALRHRGERLQVHERGIAHVHARRLGRAVGADEHAVLAARALDRVVDLARRHAVALGHELEVVDERLHGGRQLVPRRQNDLAIVGDVAALGQPVERLLDDLHRLVDLRDADREAVPVVALGADRDLELEVLVG